MIDTSYFKSDEEIAAEKRKYIQMQRTADLERITPKAFQETDVSRLEKDALDSALIWASYIQRSPLNLVLAGSTGVGKTRIAWKAIEKRFLEHGQTPFAIGCETLTRKAVGFSREGNDLIEKLRWQKLVLLDDLGKEKTTTAAESIIFEVIRERFDNRLPTIFTTNFSPKSLTARFIQRETGQAVCRRMSEGSTIVTFAKDNK